MGGSVLPSGGRQARATTRHIPGRGRACSGFAKAMQLTNKWRERDSSPSLWEN